MCIELIVAAALRLAQDPEATPEALAEMGISLDKLFGQVSEALATVKGVIRNKAGDGGKSVKISAPNGEVEVRFPRPGLRMQAPPEYLKGVLGERFTLYFETRVKHVPRREALQVANAAPSQERQLIKDSVETVHHTPRVLFRHREA